MINQTVIIVGGGPAGTACAWKLKQAGIDVLILDKKCFPRLKLCAGWITPQVFRLLGTSPNAYPKGLVRFNRLICHFRGRRIPIKTRQYAIRRYEFDAWLLERAGVPIHQHRVQAIHRTNDGFEIDGRYRAKHLVGAGGTHCPVHRELFSAFFPRSADLRISTVETEFFCGKTEPNCYLWFFENALPGYAWYVPKADGYLNIGIGGKYAAMKSRGQTINSHWRAFRKKLSAAGLLSQEPINAGGHVYYIRRRRPVLQQGEAYLTGDAAGLATVDMGEGIAPAIQSGLRAADAIIFKKPYRMPPGLRYSFPGIIYSGILRSLQSFGPGKPP